MYLATTNSRANGFQYQDGCASLGWCRNKDRQPDMTMAALSYVMDAGITHTNATTTGPADLSQNETNVSPSRLPGSGDDVTWRLPLSNRTDVALGCLMTFVGKSISILGPHMGPNNLCYAICHFLFFPMSLFIRH